MAQSNPETVKFVCDMQRKPMSFCRPNPVLFQQMVGYDGLLKLVVRKVSFSGENHLKEMHSSFSSSFYSISIKDCIDSWRQNTKEERERDNDSK